MALTRRKVLKLLAAGAAIPAIDSLSLAAAGMQTGSAHTDVPPNAPYKQAHLPIEERVKDLLSRMTLEEKARQLDM